MWQAVPDLCHTNPAEVFICSQILTCKECGADYPLEARYVCERCFGPLEVAYDARVEDVDADELRRRIQAGPQNIWRYADFLPLEGPPPRAARCRPAARRCCAPTASPSASGLREVWVKNDAANPTHSFKDRVVAVALARAARARLRDARLRLDRQPRQRGRRPRAPRSGWSPTSSSRPTSRSRRSSRPASTAPTIVRSRATTTTSTGSAPSSPASATGRSSTSTCARTTPRAPRRSRYEIAEQLGWELPDRIVAPIASGSLFTKIASGFEEWLDARPRRRATCRR